MIRISKTTTNGLFFLRLLFVTAWMIPPSSKVSSAAAANREPSPIGQRKLLPPPLPPTNIFGPPYHEKNPTERNQGPPGPFSASSEGDCSSNSTGFYGTSSTTQVDVSVEYEVEVDANKTNSGNDTLQGSVLPQVERAFADIILPALFSSTCGNVSGAAGWQLDGDLGSVVGVSSYPDELIMSGVPCQFEIAHPSHECTVVDGGLSVFTDGTTDADIEQAVISAIANTLNQTTSAFEFTPYHEAIVRVTVISVQAGGSARDVSVRDTSQAIQANEAVEGESFPPWGYVAMASGLTIIFGAMLAKRRKDQREKRAEDIDEGKDEEQDTMLHLDSHSEHGDDV